MTTETNVLREAMNKVHVEGLLLEIRHQEWKSGKGLSIEVDVEVSENEVHTIHGMSQYNKKDGSENGIAKGYQTLINEAKSVATHGREEADKIRISEAKIGKNEYYGGDGQLKSFPQLNSNFFNRVKESEEYDPRANFSVEVVVKAIKPEIKNDDETGRVIVDSFIPLFNGKIIPFEFMVNKEGSEYVQDTYEKGQTVLFHGDVVNYKEVSQTEKVVAFGKAPKEVKQKTVREYLITGGDDAYDEDSPKAYDMDVIKKALTEREVFLEELKNKKNNNQQEEKKGGFDTKATKKKSNTQDDDLPF